MNSILDMFCTSFRAKFNKSRSYVFSSKNVILEETRKISNILGFLVNENLEKYPGMRFLHFQCPSVPIRISLINSKEGFPIGIRHTFLYRVELHLLNPFCKPFPSMPCRHQKYLRRLKPKLMRFVNLEWCQQ